MNAQIQDKHHLSVAVAMMYKGRVYLSRRIKTEHYSDKWQFAGGKVEFERENPIDAAIRELEEETGLAIDISRLRYIGPVMEDSTTDVCYIYCVELFDGEVPQRTEPNKMSEWRLFPFELALKFDLMPGVPKTLRYLKNNFRN